MRALTQHPHETGEVIGMCMPENDLHDLDWHKATRGFGNGAVVEVATNGGVVMVRDSEDPDGVILRFPLSSWRSFVADAKTGRFNPPSL